MFVSALLRGAPQKPWQSDPESFASWFSGFSRVSRWEAM